MQNSGAARRENADTHSPVIVREGGRSSIPETSMIEPISRGVLDPPHARGMTAVVVVLWYFTVIASQRRGDSDVIRGRHPPRMRGIQYAAADRFSH